MRHILQTFLVFILLLIAFACKESRIANDPATAKVLRQPAEFEAQEATWLIWPSYDHTNTYSNHEVMLDLIQALLPDNQIILTASSDSVLQHALTYLPDSIQKHPSLKTMVIPSEEIWTRDMGPNFVTLDNGTSAIVDFHFNAWGYEAPNSEDPYVKRMEAFDRKVAESLGLEVITSPLISEGGNREVNGKGVLLVTKSVSKGRNPNYSLEAIEKEFRRTLGVSRVIWLEDGLVEDQHSFLGPLDLGNGKKGYTVITTNGHTDEFARFVNDSTILLASVPEEDLKDPIALENHRRMERNYEILNSAKNYNGKPFHIVRVPLPKLIIKPLSEGDATYDYLSELEYKDGSAFPVGDTIHAIAAASYLNFIIANNTVIMPAYGRDGKDIVNSRRDEQVREILSKVFPNRKVIAVDPLAINLGGGGLHCISMNQPQN